MLRRLRTMRRALITRRVPLTMAVTVAVFRIAPVGMLIRTVEN